MMVQGPKRFAWLRPTPFAWLWLLGIVFAVVLEDFASAYCVGNSGVWVKQRFALTGHCVPDPAEQNKPATIAPQWGPKL